MYKTQTKKKKKKKKKKNKNKKKTRQILNHCRTPDGQSNKHLQTFS